MTISAFSLFQNYSDILYKFVLNHKHISSQSKKLFSDKRVSHLDPYAVKMRRNTLPAFSDLKQFRI